MQQKRKFLKSKNAPLIVGAIVVVAVIALMTADVPAPQKSIEKELDAKNFLTQKQQ